MNPTYSKLDIYADCRLAACLPRVKTSSAYAAEGTVFHQFLDRVVELQKPFSPPCRGIEVEPGVWSGCDATRFTDCPTCGGKPLPAVQRSINEAREVALLEAPLELRAGLARMRLETLALDPAKIATEVAFAFDVATGRARELGRRLERRYADAAAAAGAPLTATEYCGAIDRAALVGDRGAYLGDYKRFGWNLKPVRESWQLRAGALALARAWNRDWVDIEHIILGEDGEPYGAPERLEAFDLDAFEAELGNLHQRMDEDRQAFLDGDVPEATLSDRCKHCDGHAYCPARFTFAAQVLRGEQKEVLAVVDKERPLLITQENAPRLWTMKEVGQKVLEELDRALRDWAFTNPFTTADGKVVGPVPSNAREITNAAKAKEVLQRLVGEDAAKLAWRYEVPVGALRDAARAAAAARPDLTTIDAREEWLFEELFKHGVATKREGRTVRVKPAPKKKATKGA